MKDVAKALLSDAGHTSVAGVLALKGSFNGRKPVWLAASAQGLSLVVTDADGTVFPLEPSALRYRERLLEDELIAFGETFFVPTGKGEAATKLVALGRLLPRAAAPRSLSDRRHVRLRDDKDGAAIASLLEPEEVLLVWLPTATPRRFQCAILGAVEAPFALLITDQRCALVGISDAGEIKTLPLPRRSLEIQSKFGRDEVRAADLVFDAPTKTEARFAEIKDLPALDGTARIREVARLDFESRDRSDTTLEEAGPLLRELLSRHDPVSVLVASCVSIPIVRRVGVDERNRAARLLAQQDPRGDVIGELYDAWHLTLDEGVALLEGLLAEVDIRPSAVILHRNIHRDLVKGSTGFARAAIDIAFAEHLVEAGLYVEAEDLLLERLAHLPSEALADLLPPNKADLTAGAGGQAFRIRLLELLSLAKGRGKPHLATVAELARLQPLVPERVHALADLADGDLLRGARQVLSILAPGGLSPLDDDVKSAPDARIHKLLDEVVFERMRHPSSRSGHVLDRIQSFIADANVPNHSALTKFCERLVDGDAHHRDAGAALADATFAFGIKGVSGFVSRGDRAVGVRAYEGRPNFVLIGGEHLKEEGPFTLHPWELRFAIASEIAHLRYGHTRVTSSEVWEGAWKKGKASVSFVVGFLPVLSGWSVADRLADLLRKASKSPVGRVLKGVDVTERAIQQVGGSGGAAAASPALIGSRSADLIAAHRAMQLTADRAGLLFCADIGAAIRAIFLEDPETQAELSVAIKHGLAEVLGRRDEGGEILYQGLAIRVCALLSFYLSDDYLRLRRALAEGEVDL